MQEPEGGEYEQGDRDDQQEIEGAYPQDIAEEHVAQITEGARLAHEEDA